MLRKVILVCGFTLFLACGFNANADTNDFVIRIYPCGPNLVLIEMQNAGWVYTLSQDIGAARSDAIMATALAMFSTGHATGYFNPANTASTVCGVSAKEIEALGVKDPIRS